MLTGFTVGGQVGLFLDCQHQKEQGNGLRKGEYSEITHPMQDSYQYFVPVCSG